MSVYFAQAGTNGPVKIGYTLYPKERLRELQTAHYEEIKLLRVIDGNEATEHYLHERFSLNRIRGEWFNFSPEMLTETPPKITSGRWRRSKEQQRDSVLERAIKILGGVRAAGRTLNLTAQAISQWNRCPDTWALKLEKATGGKITRYEFRPDIFGAPPGESA